MDDQVTIVDVYARVREGEWSLDDFKDWVYDNFEELETPVDPFAGLKAAHAAGKRIAVLSNVRGIKKYKFLEVPQWDGIVKDYKIVEDDEIDKLTIHLQKLNQRVEVRFTKCGLTGNITAEVVNE